MGALTTSQRQLRHMYLATTALCLFMVIWIVILPASSLQGYVGWLDEVREKHILKNTRHVPPALFEKFKGQTAVHVTHTFPGALWAGIIPFQLHPGFRKRNRRLHRAMGYVFMAVCALMMIGVYIIFQRGLLFEHFLDELPQNGTSSAEISLVAMSVWFAFTATMATIEARRKMFAAHQNWILRHIASGMWIAVQRVIIMSISPLFVPPFFKGSVPQWLQRCVFATSAQVAMVITALTGEYAIHLLKEKPAKKND
mmetsp:Transcript_11911/g.19738  ORF Transcript_11911/g.19738 Transcript_11911/m.19738 type:complete len:255 (-) Transcript_11911:248-1012(-)|eukprot:CAMPEP_0119006134 /NCGR_PEP_ID=MMETSP1176-20130426/2131_1 /TAXON_ID=265551 /ORGANISM="Synedropsis recta cf, Strain CCMP1620" /LENGTH=254 /DNA_ID=CAMNT_0006958023 /DNA_START=184 /DNA_END=948 /DNA_ORIENTATION=-